MSDKYKDNDKQKEMDDFFSQFENVNDEFDKISDSLNMSSSEGENSQKDHQQSKNNDSKLENEDRVYRSQRHKDKNGQNGSENESKFFLAPFFSKVSETFSNGWNRLRGHFIIDNSGDNPNMASTKNGKRRSKKYKVNKKKLFKALGIFVGAVAAVVIVLVLSIVFTSPSIDPDNIYNLLSESSVLYNDEGEPIESVFEADGKRTNVEFSQMPENMINAFVSLEDKTFWKHNGFNFIRIFGAIKDSFSTGQISGTSTITQQLARNVYLADTKSERSLIRKIREAYYSVQLERNLTKEQILEAYLNTIFLGYNSYGVQAASKAYFGKDVSELDLMECVSLAALPQAPDRYALIKTLNTSAVDEDTEGILYKGSQYTYVISDASKERRELCLKMMLKQEKITKEQYDLTMEDTLSAHINAGLDEKQEMSSYFTDYVITNVIEDLQNEFHLEYSEAKQMLYTNGLSVYTTMDSGMQLIIETEFTNTSNFPRVSNLKKDGNGNIIGVNNKILLYNNETYFDNNGFFVLSSEEYKANGDGSVTIFKGKRLNIFNTTVKGEPDYSLEFKDIYIMEDSIFHSMNGGHISIPAKYKNRDNDDNLIIAAEFFDDFPDFFMFDDRGMSFGPSTYLLNQKVVQPQSAMVLTEYETGQIKAMVGGRNTKGRMLFNRATSPRQPGSAIKPIAVYSAALQQGYESQAAGTNQAFVSLDNSGNEVPNYYGDFWTAASVIDDAPLKTGDKIWPKNWYNSYRGLMSLRTAVEQSVNVAAVKVISQVGFDYSANLLERMGVTTVERGSPEVNDLNPAALGLGGMTYGISPLEMVGGFGTIANYGVYVEPICYTEVKNKRGEVLLDKVPRKNQVLNEGVAWIMSDILQSVVTNGLGKPAAISSQPVAGKTGTTSDNYDAWFVGYTPKYAASLWIGNDVNIELSQGSVSAARLWSKIMRQCLDGMPRESFGKAPENVISASVDSYSGGLPSGGPTRSEYFVKGTVPSKKMSAYSRVAVCLDSGFLATPWCPNVAYKSGTDRGYSGNSEVPHYYCTYHNYDLAQYPVDPSGKTEYNFNEIPTTPPADEKPPFEGLTPPAVTPTPGGTNPGTPGETPPKDDDDEDEEVPGWLL